MSDTAGETVTRSLGSITLASAIDRIGSDGSLSRQTRHGICSALRTYARIMRRSPKAIHVSADDIRPTLRALTPTRTGLSAGRLATMRSALGFALRYLSIGEGCRPRATPISVEFEALLSTTEDRWDKMVLRRFFAYCTKIGTRPNDVTSDVLGRYLDYLQRSSLVANPALNARCIRRIWNKCSRRYSAWPQQILRPAATQGQTAVLSQTFERDLERYAAFLSGIAAHPVSGTFIDTPLRPSSRRVHLGLVRRCAERVAEAGTPVRSLHDLVAFDSINVLKSALFGRQPLLSARYIHHHLLTLQLIATRWAMAPIEHSLSPALAVGRTHATSPKKFRQIMELIDTKSLPRLLDLPNKLMTQALQFGAGDDRRIARGQIAFALEIMMMVPMSPGQLSLIQRRDLLEEPTEPANAAALTICVPSLFKPGAFLRYTLPERTGQLYQVYNKCILSSVDDSKWLFPGPGGGRRHPNGFGETISRRIAKEIGLEVMCGALRVLGGTMYLLQHPTGYEVVRQAMGYSTIAHTRRMFSFIRAVNAFHRFDSLVARSPATSHKMPRRRRQP